MSDDKPKRSDAARAAVLSRRAKFVAAALAGIACGKTSGEGHPYACLKVSATPVDAGDPPTPPDASTTSDTTDAGIPLPSHPAAKDAGPTTTTKDAGVKSKPQVCLSDPWQ